MKNIKNVLKKFNKTTIALIMAIVLFFVVFAGVFLYNHPARPKVNKDNTAPLSSIAKRLDKAMESVKGRSIAKREARKNGAAISGAEKNIGGSASSSGPVLKGMAQNRGKIKVFLNDQILCLGDVLDGYTVTEIKKDSVTLMDKDGYESTLSLAKE